MTGPRPDPMDGDAPALSLATPDDAQAQDDGPMTADVDDVTEAAGDPVPIAAGDAAAVDRDPPDDESPVDDAVAALEAAHGDEAHPMADVMAAAPVDVTGPLIDLPDDPRPTEPARTAPPIVVRAPRPRVAAPIVPDVQREPIPLEPAPVEPSGDEAGSGWGAGRWAAGLFVLAVVAVTGGAVLVRWGTPSRTPTAQVAVADAPPPAAAAPTPAPAGSSSSPPAPAASPSPTPPAEPAKSPAAAVPPSPKAVPPRAPARTAAAPAAKAAAPKAAAGRLLVRSTPGGAEVFVDGTRRGVTPLAVRDLPFGAHAVRVTRAGFAAAEQRLTLDAGRPSRTVDIALARTTPAAPAAAPVAASTPGSLTVETRPAGARVVIDGRDAGRTPLTVPSLAPGDHAVRIALDGYQPITTTTRVEPGARARVAVSLTTERPR